jgi:predicted phage terminase large subunit-like protein
MKATEALVELARRAARQNMAAFSLATKSDFDLTPFHRAICEALDRVVTGECRRLILTMPPRHGKSELVSRRLPAFFLGHYPAGQIISTSYGFELTKTFSRDVRRIMAGEVYQATFPETTLAPDSASIERWETAQGGAYLAQGVGGSITGHGADLLLCDDLIPNREAAESETQLAKTWDFFTGSLFPRLHPGGRIVLIMTRWSPGDPVGRILAGEDAAAWTVLHFPAIDDNGAALWPERYPREELERTRRAVGAYDFESLYQGRPYARGGQYLKRAWFTVIDEKDLPEGLTWIRGLDLAVSTKARADFTASVKVARHEGNGLEAYFVAGGWNQRLEWPAAKKKIVAIAEAERIRLCVEAVAGFIVAHRELEESLRGACVVQKITATKDKLTRAQPWIVAAEAGKVVLVRGPGSNDWIEEFLNEAETFPAAGVHDDLIDALSIAFEEAAHGSIKPTVWAGCGGGDSPLAGQKTLEELDAELNRLYATMTPDERTEFLRSTKDTGPTVDTGKDRQRALPVAP